jgi:hypothetical protein
MGKQVSPRGDDVMSHVTSSEMDWWYRDMRPSSRGTILRAPRCCMVVQSIWPTDLSSVCEISMADCSLVRRGARESPSSSQARCSTMRWASGPNPRGAPDLLQSCMFRNRARPPFRRGRKEVKHLNNRNWEFNCSRMIVLQIREMSFERPKSVQNPPTAPNRTSPIPLASGCDPGPCAIS